MQEWSTSETIINFISTTVYRSMRFQGDYRRNNILSRKQGVSLTPNVNHYKSNKIPQVMNILRQIHL
jgi:hypothetical protein